MCCFQNGNTPAHYAARDGYTGIIEYLSLNNVNMNAVNNVSKDEPRHDKTNKVRLRLAWESAQSDQSAVRMKKAWVLSYPLSAERRLWSDWADAQADLSLRWAHIHFVGFVVSWLRYVGVWSQFGVWSLRFDLFRVRRVARARVRVALSLGLR